MTDTPEKLWPVLGEPDWDRISKIAKPSEDMKFGGVLRGCWSEGEMVGYATCMIEQVKPLKQFIELNHNELLSARISKMQVEIAERDKRIKELEFELRRLIYGYRVNGTDALNSNEWQHIYDKAEAKLNNQPKP